MLELLNIKFSYLLRTSYQNTEGECPIVLRIVYRSQRRDVSTGLYCQTDLWDNSKGGYRGISKTAIAMNQNLDLIVHKAH